MAPNSREQVLDKMFEDLRNVKQTYIICITSPEQNISLSLQLTSKIFCRYVSCELSCKINKAICQLHLTTITLQHTSIGESNGDRSFDGGFKVTLLLALLPLLDNKTCVS